MAGTELFSCWWYPWLRGPAQARHYLADLETNYDPELSFASSSSSSFISSPSSPNECQTESISFKGTTFIYSGRWPGLVSSTLLPHPDRHISLQCPSSLSFFTPSFSPTSGLLLASSSCCWFGCYQPSPPGPAQRIFYCKATDPLCATQSWTFPPAFLPLDNFIMFLATVF